MIRKDKSGGLKYLVSEQHVVSPRKSNWVGTEWKRMKMVHKEELQEVMHHCSYYITCKEENV